MTVAVIDWDDHPPEWLTGGAITVGNFDGVHQGHISLIQRAGQLARPVVAITFDPPPYDVLNPADLRQRRPTLTTMPQRGQLLHQAGADHVAILTTTPALLALSPEAFFEEVILRRFHARAIVEGNNFRFGRGRSGDIALLQKLCQAQGIVFQALEPVRVKGIVVSSSTIRDALVFGNVVLARELLGRPYSIMGQVSQGAQRGQQIGFPTANLEGVANLIPADGVYAVRARVDHALYSAAANIGPNPTFKDATRKVEIHILDFDGDLYGQTLEVEFHQRLRGTMTFDSVDGLIRQIESDISQVRTILANNHFP